VAVKKPILRRRSFSCAVAIAYICHHEPTKAGPMSAGFALIGVYLVGEESAVPSLFRSLLQISPGWKPGASIS